MVKTRFQPNRRFCKWFLVTLVSWVQCVVLFELQIAPSSFDESWWARFICFRTK